MSTEEKLIAQYIGLCDLMCKEPADYVAERVKIHNKAMKQMLSLTQTLRNDIALAQKVYDVLLHCDDSFVRQMAATECLSLKIHTRQAIAILKKISRNGNRMAAMAAKRALLIRRGKLNPNDPF